MEATVVVRTVGERTEGFCCALLAKQAAEVTVVRRTPFSEALAETFEAGIRAGLPYTIAVDADVLPFGNLVQVLVEEAAADGSDWFEKHARVWDHLFGSRRCAGNRVYRTALLPKALKLVRAFGATERPEREVVVAMAGRGYGSAAITRLVGMHAWEQFYRDLYRTAYVHAVKSTSRCTRAVKLWRKRVDRDADFVVVMAGYEAGLRHEGALAIDASRALGEVPRFAEKRPLKRWKQLAPVVRDAFAERGEAGG